jgi:uncharacterized RDD family membrane protein YckC
MKCPKCGYLGFETTDRCRNCQYDFSLAPPVTEPELTLHDRRADVTPDFELPMKRHTDTVSATALDLDRLFGEPEPARAPAASVDPIDTTPTPHDAPVAAAEPVVAAPVALEAESSTHAVVAESEPAHIDATPAEPVSPVRADVAASSESHDSATTPPEDDALPFDDVPLVPPPAARTPLAVRRSQPDPPRTRHRTTRPVRMDTLKLEPATEPPSTDTAVEAMESIKSLLEPPSVGVRLAAGAIDASLMAGLFAAVVYLTLRVAGLQNTFADLRLLPPAPFVGFLAVIAFGYTAAFTVGGGQTIGKMILNVRVIGDDGRAVDAAGGVLRAAGCLLVPITLGLSYLPALFTSDHRAVHDRLAGTRVVQE